MTFEDELDGYTYISKNSQVEVTFKLHGNNWFKEYENREEQTTHIDSILNLLKIHDREMWERLRLEYPEEFI